MIDSGLAQYRYFYLPWKSSHSICKRGTKVPQRGYIIPAMSGDLRSMEVESKEDFLARVKESPEFQGWTYIPS